MKHISLFTAIGVCLSMLSGCGSDSSTAATTSLSGAVADGYLSGATVCLDINNNGVCDIGEPSGTTGTNGAYTISGITQGDESKYPLLVYVPATAVDSDSPNTTVGTAYTMSAPAGRNAFISPLTTLVHHEMMSTNTSESTAETKVKTDVNLKVSAFDNYMTQSSSNDYVAAHKTAQVVVKSMQANSATLGSDAVTDINATRKALVAIAKRAVSAEASTTAGVVTTITAGVEDKATLLAAIAAKKAEQAAATQDVSIAFDLVNGTMPVVCGQSISLTHITYDHKTNKAASPEVSQQTAGQLIDTRFYISNVMLIDAAGNKTPVVLTENENQSKGVSLLDFGYNTASSGVTCSSAHYKNIVGKVKPGTYTGIEMTLGVPIRSADMITSLNHSNLSDTTNTPIPLQSTGLGWSWQSGRKFTKIEFLPAVDIVYGTGTKKVAYWPVHLGSTGCSGDPVKGSETTCTNPNRVGIELNSFNASTQKVALDVAALFAKSDVTYESTGAPPGCMSSANDAECPAIFSQLGLNFATGLTSVDSATGKGTQQVFKVMSK